MSDFTVRPGIVLRDVEPDSIFGFEFFTFRSPPAVLEMDLFIEHAKGKRCFMDIGANAGIFSCVFQTLNHATCHAFEPSHYWYTRLLHNVKALDVTPWPLGLSDHDGQVEGHYEGNMFITGETELMGIDHTKVPEKHLIRVWHGDWFCEAFDVAPDIIKIDVEGHEAAVLKGLMRTITRCKPIIFIEVHRGFLERIDEQRIFDAVFDLLPPHDEIIISDHNKMLIFK